MSNEVIEVSELVENHTDGDSMKSEEVMPDEVAEISEVVENHKDDALVEHGIAVSSNGHEDGNRVVKVNGLNESGHEDLDREQLVNMIVELNFQNEYLKAQFEGFKGKAESKRKEAGEENVAAGDVMEMQEKIDSLSRELLEEKQTRAAAEEALKHLRAVYEEADAKAQELSAKLSETQQQMNQEIKDRDEKYTELDSKLNRLHKRAKQRIQDVQKEKDELEARLRGVNETAEQASAQQSSLQKELERTRQQANEALKSMDLERQQLRSANNKLRDEIEELRKSLQPKEHALETLQQSLTEKDQMLEEMRGSLQAADEKRQASIAEVSAKHQRNIESLEGQLADALSDRNKVAETIASLQVLLVEKESKIAEMDAASTGEAARLKAAMETLKVELIHQKTEHDKEKEMWESATAALKAKLEVAEGSCIRAEIEAAKMRSQREYEVSVQTQLLNAKVSELTAAKEEINHLENEFSSYKHRAHALLQKKDAELVAAKDSEQLKALEEALKESEKEIISAMSERDRVIQDLESALFNHDKELASRDEALRSMEQQLQSLEAKLDSASARHQSEKEGWESDIKNLEETWRLRCETLKIEKEVSFGEDLHKEIKELRLQNKRLKEEHDSFRDLADRMIGEKDTEISKLIDDNKTLRRSLEMRPAVNDDYNSALQKQDASNLNASVAEQQILLLARQQAQREEELAQSQRHILALQEEIEELERENRLHSQQEAMLKAEMRNMERSQKREGVDLTYLKNVVLKLLETGEVEALLPVIGMLLQFSPEEIQKCQQAYRASTEVPPNPSSNSSSGSSYSLFSRFVLS